MIPTRVVTAAGWEVIPIQVVAAAGGNPFTGLLIALLMKAKGEPSPHMVAAMDRTPSSLRPPWAGYSI